MSFFVTLLLFESFRKIKVGKLNRTNHIATRTHICFTSWGLFTSNKIKEINKADKPPKNPKPQAFPETRPIFLSVDNSFKYELQKTHPISNEIFEIITKAIAKDKSPFSGKYNKAVNSEHRIVKKTRNDFLYPVSSAKAPNNGDKKATIIAVIEIAFAHKNVPSISLGAI